MSLLIDILAVGVTDGSGSPLENGVVYAYQPGTTTKVDMFQDSDLTIPHPNPLTLDSVGKAEVYVETPVRLVIEDSDGNTVTDLASVGGDIEASVSADIVSQQLVPVGSIIPHYDFNGALPFDSSYWAYCDGQSKLVGGVLRQLPDLSGRYLVGFGTESGGDIDSAVWATAQVGNASHQVDLAHTHTGPSHTHTITSEVGLSTNSESSHTHTDGSLYCQVVLSSGGGRLDVGQASSPSWNSTNRMAGTGDDGSAGGAFTTAARVEGSTGAGSAHSHTIPNHDHGGTTGASGTGATSSSLSATQSIQPSSVRVRYLMRLR